MAKSRAGKVRKAGKAVESKKVQRKKKRKQREQQKTEGGKRGLREKNVRKVTLVKALPMRKFLDGKERSFCFIEKRKGESFFDLLEDVMVVARDRFGCEKGALLEEKKTLRLPSGQEFQAVSYKNEHIGIGEALLYLSSKRAILKETEEGLKTIQGKKVGF